MVAIVSIERGIWPFDGWRNVPFYDRRQSTILDAADRYAQVIGDEVTVATGRDPSRGRTLMWLGHGLGWGGLALTLFGLFGLREADLETLLFGPFGIGLLMQLPSGALVRAGRRHLRPTPEERQAVDRRRPVLMLRGAAPDRAAGEPDPLAGTFEAVAERYGPLIDAAADPAKAFGESDVKAALARRMDQAVLLVVVPSADPAAIAWDLDTIAKRRHVHKTLVLLPPATGTAGADAARQRWAGLRAGLKALPDFHDLPEQAPAGALAVHLSTSGEPVILTGPSRPSAADFVRAVAFAVYGMKCHGRM